MKTKIFTFLFSILILSNISSHAQYLGPNSTWYFGQYAGLTWDTLQANGDPMYLMDGALTTNEGVASISDYQGNLLFYTDGISVWDRFHTVMSNSLQISPGGALQGDFSSTHSAVIVPKPMNPDVYYIFTSDANIGQYGTSYSRLDMAANSGLGDIDPNEKNISLFTPSSEKIAVAKHDNGIDYWVITHQWNNNQFNVYLVTSSGVNDTVPVISIVGAVYSGGSDVTRGYIKVSPMGNMVAMGIEGLDVWELYNFDNLTGQLSNPITLYYVGSNACYGVEFSADGHYLYGSERWGVFIHQWDVWQPTPAAISASHQIVDTTLSAFGGALQLGLDQKIYLARKDTKYLGRINQPSLSGSACNYVDQAVLLGPDTASARMSQEGLPAFIPTYYFNLENSFYTSSCDNDTVFFVVPNSQGLDSAWWNFNYPSTDTFFHHIGVEDSVYFIYSTGGIYTVELITQFGSIFDTLYTDVYFSQTPIVDLGPDVTLCPGDSLFFDLSFNNINSYNGYCGYFWEAEIDGQSFNESTATYIINQPGTYTASVYADPLCSSVADSIHVDYLNFDVDLGWNTVLCKGDTITLDAQNPGLNYNWSNGDTNQTIEITEGGTIWVEVTNSCETKSDTIYIIEQDTSINLGPDTALCAGDLLILDATTVGAIYTWSTGASTPIIGVFNTGNYSVTVNNYCTSFSDDINLTMNPMPEIFFPNDTLYLQTGSTILLQPEYLNPTSTTYYEWSDGSSDSTLLVSSSGLYSVTVSNEFGCSSSDYVLVISFININDVEAKELLSIFPNPVKNKLYISFDRVKVNEIQIYGSSGSLISQFTNIEGSLEVNTQHLSEGIYFVKIRTREDEVAIKSFSVVR